MITLIRPVSSDLWNVATRLVKEYATSLNMDLGFQEFDKELAHLATEYGPPLGSFLLAEHLNEFVGCGAIRRVSQSACEMKRLYVVPPCQSLGIGRKVATALLQDARDLGYKTVLLDTLPSMQRAQQLYRSLGFKPVSSYRFNPVPDTVFLKLDL